MAKDIKKMLAEKLQQNTERHAAADQSVAFDEGRELISVLVDKIEPNPYQPRRIFPQDELNKLAQSIAEVGLLEPILLRKMGDKYQIAAGERRWRAHKQIERRHIDAVVMNISDSDMAVFALAENIDREDLSDYEIGLALKQVEKAFPTKKKLAESMGMNRQDMYRYYAYDDLPQFIIDDLNSNPRLLSRSAATDIKRLLNENKDNPSIDDFLFEAWDLLIEKELDQTKVTDYVARKLKNNNSKNTQVQDAHNLFQNGKKVGNITRTDKHITVKLNSSALSADKEETLKIFIANLINDE